MNILNAFLVLISLSGCTTTAYWTQKRYQPKGGVVGYRTTGMGMNVEQRVVDADNKMKEFCLPQLPVVLSENNETRSAGTMYNAGLIPTATPINEEYKEIDFRCEDRKPAGE